MWQIVIIFFIVMIFSQLDDIIEFFKSKNLNYQDEKKQEIIKKKQVQLGLFRQVNGLIGCECVIINHKLIYTSIGKIEVTATIIDLDDEWLEIETIKGNKKIRLYIKLQDTVSVSKVIT